MAYGFNFGLFRRETTPGVPASTAAQDTTPKSTNWEANVVKPYGRSSLLVPAWYRGVSLIMQTMGQMVTQYQRMSKEGGNFIEDRWGANGRLNYLLQVRPNPIMTASQLQEQIEYRKTYFGNAFVYIERDEFGDLKALWLCNNGGRGGYNYLTNTYTLSYVSDHGPVLLSEVPAADVLHFKNVFMTDDYLMGIPTLEFAFKALEIAATADDQALQDVAKGGKHKVLIQEEKSNPQGTRGRVNPNELRNTAKRFGEDWQANDVVVLDNVADAKIISQTSQQLQLLEQRSFQVSDLARILGIPRIMMMEDAGSSYKMPEHATQEFLLRTIQPRIREWEDELNSKLLGMDDFGKRRIHVCELPLRRLDAKGQAEIDKIHLETGVNTVNELRQSYDLPAVDKGDTIYVSTNLAELGSEKLRAAASGGRPTTDNKNPKDGEEGDE